MRQIRDLGFHSQIVRGTAGLGRNNMARLRGMRPSRLVLLAMVMAVALAGCKLKATDAGPQGQIPAPPDVAAPPANAFKTSSGLAFKVLTVGLGNSHPTPNSTVRVHYTLWTPDGKMVESSVPGGEPATFVVGKVIPGWVEALQLMVAGEKRRFWIPGPLAYDKSTDPNDPKGMLVFDIELIEIK